MNTAPTTTATPTEPYYIVKAANHAERFGADYPFTRYPERERAGRVAAKMAERTGVKMHVIRFDADGTETDEGSYGPG